MYTIILNDGTKLENLRKNGDNFISDIPVDDSVFEGNLAIVEISDGETTETFTDMVLIQNRQYGDEYWFVLAVLTPQEKAEIVFREQVAEMSKIVDALLGTEV